MTKHFILSLTILSMLSCGSSSDQKNDKKIDAEKKRIAELGIKSQTEFTYLWVDSLKKYSDQKIKSSFVQYDHSGNVITQIRYDMNGNEQSKKTSEFDTKGNMKLHSDYFNGKLSYKVIKEFAGDGREIGFLYYTEIDTPILKNIKVYNGDILKKEITLNLKSNDTSQIILYNDKGKMIEDKNFSDNLFTKRTVYNWTPDERQVNIKELGSDGSIRTETSKRLDENGNEIEKIEMIPYPSDTLRNYFFFDYDSQGNKIKEIWYRPANDTIYIKTWKFDDKNHLIETMTNEFDYFQTNERHEISTKTEGQSKSITITKYQFEYDKQGNLIKAFASKNGQPNMTTTYEYSYK